MNVFGPVRFALGFGPLLARPSKDPELPPALAVNESQAHEILGLNDGRSLRARKDAFYLFRLQHDIRPLPGRVFSARRIKEAADGTDA